MKIEILGHTDTRDSVYYNQKLSDSWAKTVVDYLVINSIAQNSLKYKRGKILSNLYLQITTKKKAIK